MEELFFSTSIVHAWTGAQAGTVVGTMESAAERALSDDPGVLRPDSIFRDSSLITARSRSVLWENEVLTERLDVSFRGCEVTGDALVSRRFFELQNVNNLGSNFKGSEKKSIFC